MVGWQGQVLAGEEVFQRAGERDAERGCTVQQGLGMDRFAVAQEPAEQGDHLAGAGGVVAGRQVAGEAGQPGGPGVQAGREVAGPDGDAVRGLVIAAGAQPGPGQAGDGAAGAAGRIGRRRPAGAGAGPAPARVAADPPGLAAPRARLLSLRPAFPAGALAAELPADPADLRSAAGAHARAQHAPAGGRVQDLVIAAARTPVLGRPVRQRVAAAGAVLAALDPDGPAAADAHADLHRHPLP